MATSTALYDPFNAHLVAGSAVASVRDENSSTGAVSTMIVVGGVSVRFTGRGKVPVPLLVKDVEVTKFIAVCGLTGEHADGIWWVREDQFNLMDADDNFEAPKAMKRSWGRVIKTALKEPLYAPRFPGTAGSREDWERLVDRSVELHNEGKLADFIATGAKDKWLNAPFVYPPLATISLSDMDLLKSDPEVQCARGVYCSVCTASAACPRLCATASRVNDARPLHRAGPRITSHGSTHTLPSRVVSSQAALRARRLPHPGLGIGLGLGLGLVGSQRSQGYFLRQGYWNTGILSGILFRIGC